MSLCYAIHILQMKLGDLQHENEQAEARIAEQWSDYQCSRYCENLPRIETLKNAISILKDEQDASRV